MVLVAGSEADIDIAAGAAAPHHNHTQCRHQQETVTYVLPHGDIERADAQATLLPIPSAVAAGSRTCLPDAQGLARRMQVPEAASPGSRTWSMGSADSCMGG